MKLQSNVRKPAIFGAGVTAVILLATASPAIAEILKVEIK